MSQHANELPKFDGQVAQLSTWLRALRQAEHHLPDDVAFFVRTGAKVNSNGTLSVTSVRHALLLHHGLLEQCGYGVTRPPPVADRFEKLYNDIRKGNAGFTANGITLPATADALPDALATGFFVRPYAQRHRPQTTRPAAQPDRQTGLLQVQAPHSLERVGRAAYESAPPRIGVERSRLRA